MLFELVDVEPDIYDPVQLHFSYTDAAGHPGRVSRIAYFHPQQRPGSKTIRFAATPVMQ
ncbi:hypothetical protein D3C85_1854980 [compost metagenome]